jgi:hypothetical protein
MQAKNMLHCGGGLPWPDATCVCAVQQGPATSSWIDAELRARPLRDLRGAIVDSVQTGHASLEFVVQRQRRLSGWASSSRSQEVGAGEAKGSLVTLAFLASSVPGSAAGIGSLGDLIDGRG